MSETETLAAINLLAKRISECADGAALYLWMEANGIWHGSLVSTKTNLARVHDLADAHETLRELASALVREEIKP